MPLNDAESLSKETEEDIATAIDPHLIRSARIKIDLVVVSLVSMYCA